MLVVLRKGNFSTPTPVYNSYFRTARDSDAVPSGSNDFRSALSLFTVSGAAHCLYLLLSNEVRLVKNISLEETVLRFLGLVTSILLVLSCFTAAQDHSTVDLFAGYQYTHVALGHNLNGFNLNGWNVSASAFFNKHIGISADFSGNYGSPRISALSTNVSAQNYTYLFGPIVRVPNSSKIEPYFHVLFGGAHINANGFGLSGSDNSFAWAMGGGLDANLNSRFAVRLGQFDWLRTQFADSTQSNFRYSAGVVIRF